MIAVTRPINGAAIDAREYVREGGDPLLFGTRKDALRHLADRNVSLAELIDFDYELEEIEDE